MNAFSKIVLGGAGAGLLGLGTLGATSMSALAATPAPKATAAQPAAPATPARDPRADRKLIAAAVFQAEAGALGMSPADLRKALKNGQSVSDIAAQKALTKEQVADRILAGLKPNLDKLVDSGKITRPEADRALDHLKKIGGVPFWEGRHKK